MRNIGFSREPVIWITVTKAGIYALALFVLKASAIQMLGIIAFFEVVGAILQRRNSFALVNKDGNALAKIQYSGGKVETVRH